MTSVVTHQATKPCQRAVLTLVTPHSLPATTPPQKEAMMPDSVHQRPAPMEKVLASGFSAELAALNAAAPMPMPSRLSRSWTTNAVTTPATMAPQDARLERYVCHSSEAISVEVVPTMGSSGLTVMRGCSGCISALLERFGYQEKSRRIRQFLRPGNKLRH